MKTDEQVILERMVGKTFSKVEKIGDDCLMFQTEDGYTVSLFHEQNCCERVDINDICGDLSDLVGSPILQSEEVQGFMPAPENAYSYTWTFYKFATNKGSVTVRWLGESNGYYSERVSVSEEYRRD